MSWALVLIGVWGMALGIAGLIAHAAGRRGLIRGGTSLSSGLMRLIRRVPYSRIPPDEFYEKLYVPLTAALAILGAGLILAGLIVGLLD